MSASREADLAKLAAMIRKWNPAINLVAPSTLSDLEERHISDSLQLANLADRPAGLWLDIGSGGGLPGLVLATCHRDCEIRLVDSDRRKVAFLQAAIRELALEKCTAVASRIEDLPPASADNLSARALAPLVRLMPYLARHLAQNGTAWLMKGRNWQAELETARETWKFHVVVHPSATDPSSAILAIRDVHHG